MSSFDRRLAGAEHPVRAAGELRADLNDSTTDADIVEMLAQHLITKPVFDALFEGYSFASKNPMSTLKTLTSKR